MGEAMHIPELDSLNSKRAVGILSRIVLDLESSGLNPAARPLDDTESRLRRSIIERAKAYLSRSGAPHGASDENQRLIELLDQEADARAEPIDEKEAIARLSASGDIPSDVLSVDFATKFPTVLERATDFDDQHFVRFTLRSPDYAYRSPIIDGERLDGVSLFAKRYNFGSEQDAFLFVVCGSVVNSVYEVSYYVRVYENDVNLFGITNPVDALLRFAAKYGMRFGIEDWNGKFLVHSKFTPHRIGESFVLRPGEQIKRIGDFALVMRNNDDGRRNGLTATTYLSSPREDGIYIAFAITIDPYKYNNDVKKHLRREKIVFSPTANSLVRNLTGPASNR